MDVNGLGALSAYAYQTTLDRTGSRSQALGQAMTLGQAQAAETSDLLASVGPVDALAALPALGGPPALFPGTDNLPVSAAALAPSATQALVRYAYDQSQNPDRALQQAQLGTGLDFLA